jgi:multiple sugar transport system ATP-binding protein
MGSIELVNVRKDFGGFAVINGVDLKVEDGEFTVFVGPSGCGKSTLLRLIAGLEDISSGQVLIDGKDVSRIGPSQWAVDGVPILCALSAYERAQQYRLRA